MMRGARPAPSRQRGPSLDLDQISSGVLALGVAERKALVLVVVVDIVEGISLLAQAEGGSGATLLVISRALASARR